MDMRTIVLLEFQTYLTFNLWKGRGQVREGQTKLQVAPHPSHSDIGTFSYSSFFEETLKPLTSLLFPLFFVYISLSPQKVKDEGYERYERTVQMT